MSGWQLPVRVTPRSARPGLGPWRAGADGRLELEVRVAAAPSDSEANEAVLRLVAAALDCRPSALAVAAGATSRHKRIAVPLDEAEARRRLP